MTKFCPICGTGLLQGIQSWHWECPGCKYENVNLKPAINQIEVHRKLDERSRELGLKSLRTNNFNKLLEIISSLVSPPKSILDVGCAHGWFIDQAQRSSFTVLGIEPDLNIYRNTFERGLPVRQGFFPDVLNDDEKFDAIIFNDVFEHIPDLQKAIDGCRTHLHPGGILILNLPSSSGFLYKIARIFSRSGFSSFFERHWQKDLPSPHLHCFNVENLNQLLNKNHFDVIKSGRLDSVHLNGLLTRITYAGSYSRLVAILIYLSVFLILPIIRLMPSDIIYVISRKQPESNSSI